MMPAPLGFAEELGALGELREQPTLQEEDGWNWSQTPDEGESGQGLSEDDAALRASSAQTESFRANKLCSSDGSGFIVRSGNAVTVNLAKAPSGKIAVEINSSAWPNAECVEEISKLEFTNTADTRVTELILGNSALSGAPIETVIFPPRLDTLTIEAWAFQQGGYAARPF